MRLLYIALMFLLVSDCKQTKSLLGQSTLNQEELSVFQSYSGKKCELAAVGGSSTITNCENLRYFVDPNSEHCRLAKEKGLLYATFPDQGRRLRICKDLAQPERQSQDRIRFLILGDVGVGQSNDLGYQQRKVAEAMQAICPSRAQDEENGCDFAIILGDLIYYSGVHSVWDPQFNEKFEQIYDVFGAFDIYVVAGNHDYQGNVSAQVEYTYFSERWRMPGRHYPIESLPPWLAIYGLDTTPVVDAGGDFSEQLASMQQTVCDKDAIKIFFGHHPLLSHGKHGGEPLMQSVLERVAEKCPFDFYLAGHDHHQEHISTEDFELIVQGAGGAEIHAVDLHPGTELSHLFRGRAVTYQQRYAKKAHGFSVVEVDPSGVNIAFYDIDRWKHRPGVGFPDAEASDHIYKCRWLRTDPAAGCVPQAADAPAWLRQ